MIYFVEGIPAGGKSFYARSLRKKLMQKKDVIYFKEEYKNPIDLLRQAFLTSAEYENLLIDLRNISSEDEYWALFEDIQGSISTVDNFICIPFMHIKTQNETQRKRLDSLYEKELDDGKCTYTEYCNMIIKRIQMFLQESTDDIDYIFEGALLHNPLVSILGFYNVGEAEIVQFYKIVNDILSTTEYEIHLVCCDNIDKAINHAVETRKKNTAFDWEKGFELWFKQSNNYKTCTGRDGIISFAKDVFSYEKLILAKVQFRQSKIRREV